MEIVKNLLQKKKHKLKAKKDNYSEIFNQTRYNIDIEIVTTTKF